MPRKKIKIEPGRRIRCGSWMVTGILNLDKSWHDITADNKGNLYLTCSQEIWKAEIKDNNPTVELLLRIDSTTSLCGILWNKNDNSLYFTSPLQNKIFKYQLDTSTLHTYSIDLEDSIIRYIPKKVERILDAPNLEDDFYLNVLDWNKDNLLAIGLSDTVYLCNVSYGQVTELFKTQNDSNIITSVSWSREGTQIAFGTNDGNVHLWDVEVRKPLRILQGHSDRVGVLSWSETLLSSGSRDTTVRNWDVRIQNSHISTYTEHIHEVCGLKWSDDGTQLASGGNDNTVNIWDVGAVSPKYTFSEHQAAVKAVAWCPWQKDLLATGAGTNDLCIKFWNTSTGSCLNTIETPSQVNSLVWARNCKEIISGHGYPNSQLIAWKYPSMSKSAELRGHTGRIMQLAMSPNSKTIVSAGADETLRFWKAFDVAQGFAVDKNGDVILSARNHIRKLKLKEETFEIIAGHKANSGHKDGQAQEALFEKIVGLAMSEDGTVYVADNGTIRQIKGGWVTTIAGGNQSEHNLCNPTLEYNGNVLIIDVIKRFLLRFDFKRQRVFQELRDLPKLSAMTPDGKGNFYLITGNTVSLLEYAWKYERLFWIAHLKENPKDCKLAWLPRDIIQEILRLYVSQDQVSASVNQTNSLLDNPDDQS